MGHPATIDWLNRLSHLNSLPVSGYKRSQRPPKCRSHYSRPRRKIVDLLFLLEIVLAYRSKTVDGAGKVYFSEAIRLAPEGHQRLPSLFNDLGFYLPPVSTSTEIVQTLLSGAAACLDMAVNLTPEGHPDISLLLHNLGKACLRSSESPTRDDDWKSFICRITDLSAATQTLQNAGKFRSCSPRKDAHILEDSWSRTLAQLRGTRGYWWPRSSDWKHEAVNLTLRGDADITIRLKDLGVSLQQSRRTASGRVVLEDRAAESRGDLLDIQAAVSNYALSATWPRCLHDLTLLRVRRYESDFLGYTLWPHIYHVSLLSGCHHFFIILSARASAFLKCGQGVCISGTLSESACRCGATENLCYWMSSYETVTPLAGNPRSYIDISWIILLLVCYKISACFSNLSCMGANEFKLSPSSLNSRSH
jgi:hypothetical protein